MDPSVILHFKNKETAENWQKDVESKDSVRFIYKRQYKSKLRMTRYFECNRNGTKKGASHGIFWVESIIGLHLSKTKKLSKGGCKVSFS